jgi:excisionase family DNA binding protein
MKEGKFRSYDDLPLTLTVPEVGEVLGISRAKAYDLARSEGFPSMRIGTRILVPRDKLIRWIDKETEAQI